MYDIRLLSVGRELTPQAGRPSGLPALSGQDETLGSKGGQVKSGLSGVVPVLRHGSALDGGYRP